MGQFTELQQKEQLAKLAMARQALASAPTTKKFKFISGVNDQVCVCQCCVATQTHRPILLHCPPFF